MNIWLPLERNFSAIRPRVRGAQFLKPMTRKLTLLTLLLFAGWWLPRLEAQSLPAPALASLEVMAVNGAGVEKHFVSNNGVAGRIGVNLNQVVPVTLQFPADKAGMPVAVGSLDGGEILGSHAVVLPTGKVLFTFRAPEPGVYRLMVELSGEQHRIEFYVIDPSRPRPASPH